MWKKYGAFVTCVHIHLKFCLLQPITTSATYLYSLITSNCVDLITAYFWQTKAAKPQNISVSIAHKFGGNTKDSIV